ncbi:MAG: TonB-dependent receptor, partial [Rhodospirillaceae bacterium]|nr:TonB-dependent receptor [Rhodospirillaceae bacterium]
LGVRGDIAENWSYDVYFSRGEADQKQIRGNWGSLSKVQQALRAVSTTTCTNTSNGCVPLNIFGAAGSITQPMLNFINLNAILGQRVSQKVASANLAGDLGEDFKSPFASLPIGLAIGAEYRKLFAANQSDGSSQIQGEVLGTGAPLPDRSGTFNLKEVYAETVIPLVTDQPFMEKLNFEGGYRRTRFTTTASDEYGSAKFGGEWEPVSGLRFRGMGQRATRAPNVNELFAPAVSGLTNLAVDPCQGTLINQAQANTAGTLSNLCRLTGVPVTVIGQLPAPSAGQVNTIAGGNPALGPEKAKTMTLGFVWEPEFINNFALTLDYYKIALNQAIERPAATDVLDQCYTTAFNPGLVLNAACAQVRREPSNGTFNGATAPGIVRPLSNLGQIDTSGWDLGVTYSVAFEDMGADSKWGRLSISFQGNKMNSYFQQPTPSSVRRDCMGYYSVACEEPVHKYKWNQRTTWFVGDFDFSYNWRHISSVIEEPGGTNFFPAFASIPDYNYIDISAGWDITENARIALAVNNLFDKDPPNVGQTIGTTGTNSGNTFPQNYDTIGRFFSLSTVMKF